ncbi:MAG: MBL fold metallo-hydrolase [Candidatus Thorarchaeota archaeon]|nr:MAG: MBL fold metallo-hydrolase [Candidatus Thorarchaeota archaeon]
MRILDVGNRGAVFEFDDPYLTNVYVINSIDHIFICDTFCGPKSMDHIKTYVREIEASTKPIVVFNSHHHYDHIWGNCAFEDEIILATTQCKNEILNSGAEALERYNSHMKGEVRILLPTDSFETSRFFSRDGVEFFHSPGHSADSASCFDKEDRILFVGDNVESPIPFLFSSDLTSYATTLKSYLDMDWGCYVPSHDPPSRARVLIEENLDYVEQLSVWDLRISRVSENARIRHCSNLLEIAPGLGAELEVGSAREQYADALQFLEDKYYPEHEDMVVRFRKILS